MIRTPTSASLLAAFLLLSIPTARAQPQPPAQASSGRPIQVAAGPVDNGLDAAWRDFRRRGPSQYDPYGGVWGAGWGYRNPGHVGRMAEYYPPGNSFQNAGAHPHLARFSEGPVETSRAMQLQSQMIGIARYNAIQGHIDRYGAGFGAAAGFGFGFGAGFGLAFPN
jgi:hypothetical protein